MKRRGRRLIVVFLILVLLGGLGVGAVWVAKKGLRKEPPLKQAQRAYQTGKFEQAVDLARKALAAEPDRDLAQRMLLDSLIQAKRLDEAKAEARKYASQGKDFADVALCELAIRTGDLPEAQKLARAMTGTHPAFSHRILAVLSDFQGIVGDNWKVRLGAANTMRGLAAVTESKAVRAEALLFSATVHLEVLPFLPGTEDAVERARGDLREAAAAAKAAYEADHSFPLDRMMGFIRILSSDKAEAENGARTLRGFATGIDRQEDAIAALAAYHLRRDNLQEATDLIGEVSDAYLWNRMFWLLRHGGQRKVALQVLATGASATDPQRRLMRASILLMGESDDEKAEARKILDQLIRDPATDTKYVLKALIALVLRVDLKVARDVAEAAEVGKRNDKRITALMAFLMNADENDKERALEMARELAEGVDTAEESSDMLYLLGGGTDVLNSYLDAQIAKGGVSGLQHRLRRAITNLGLSRNAAAKDKGELQEKAVSDLRAVLADKDAAKAALLGAFSISASLGEGELAGRLLARAIAMPGDPQSLPLLMLELAFRQQDQENVKKLSAGVAAMASQTQAPAFVGIFADVMQTRGQIDVAMLDRIEASARADAGSKKLGLELACRVALGLKELDRAEKLSRELLEEDADHLLGRQMLGDVLANREKWDEVLKLYEGQARVPEGGYYQCVNALGRLDRKDEALKAARAALAAYPRSVQAYVVLARVHIYMGDARKALGVLNVAPSNTYVANMRAGLLTQLKDYPEAQRIYMALLHTDYNNQQVWVGTHRVMILQGKGDEFLRFSSELLQDTEKIAADAPVRGAIHGLRGQTFESRGEMKEGLSEYEDVLKFNPDAWAALNNAAWHIAKLEPIRIQKAKEYIEKAMKLRPNEASLLDTAAEVHRVLGNTDDALKMIESCLVLAPPARAAEYLLHKAEILLGADREAEAREVLGKITTDYADSNQAQAAKDELSKLDFKDKQDEEAEDTDGKEK